MIRRLAIACFVIGAVILLVGAGEARVDYGNRIGESLGAPLAQRTQGPGVLVNAVDPALRRWYVNQELYQEYRWRQWESTSYARDAYRRYVNTDLEGSSFYDVYGNFVTRGFLIFNNSQERPEQFGNTLFKSDRFEQWFSNVVIARDQKGEYAYALTVSSQLNTTLTPLTFRKPNFDGVQFDFGAERIEGTMIYSRISNSGGSSTGGLELRRTNNTTLFGGRVVGELTDFARLGLTMVNAHQSNTLDEQLAGNPFKGGLTIDQNQTIDFVEVVLRDDSPDDGVGGAAFFESGSDVSITYKDGTVERGSQIGFAPAISGGFGRAGFLAADGTEEIRLKYDFDTPQFAAGAHAHKDSIVKVEFDLVVGNDYQIWMTSNRQNNQQGQTVLLLVERADGNVQDVSNIRTVSFDYGLPTATHIMGATLELLDFHGFNFYGEADLNWNFRKYPNRFTTRHNTSSGLNGEPYRTAWFVNLWRRVGPALLFGEAFAMDPHYNTTTFVTSGDGEIDYETPRRGLVELVDDNDDHDRIADNVRFDHISGDNRVFPGWDQNNDFVPDFNQNDNIVRANRRPDYEEPFLRFDVDRPEFLFGVDMNNNFWVDQFENDDQPDYPYRKDHRGFNLYAAYDVWPELQVAAGVMREELISANQQNEQFYLMAKLDKSWPQWGEFKLFEMSKLVQDNIPDQLLQWEPSQSLDGGRLTQVEDPMLARDTWMNQFFVGHKVGIGRTEIETRVNYQLFEQLMGDSLRVEFNLGERDYFFGAINKIRYRRQLGKLTIEPRWKSEYLKQTRGLFGVGKGEQLRELLGVVVERELLAVTRIQAGLEVLWNQDFNDDANDFSSQSIAVQLANTSDYLGYEVVALAGLRLRRQDFKEAEPLTTSMTFVSIFAGLR